MAFTKLLGIGSIAPFMSLVGDMSLLQQGGIYIKLCELSGINHLINFLFISGIGALIALSISTVVSIFITWRLSLFGASVGVELADRLYTHYMKRTQDLKPTYRLNGALYIFDSDYVDIMQDLYVMELMSIL